MNTKHTPIGAYDDKYWIYSNPVGRITCGKRAILAYFAGRMVGVRDAVFEKRDLPIRIPHAQLVNGGALGIVAEHSALMVMESTRGNAWSFQRIVEEGTNVVISDVELDDKDLLIVECVGK